MRINSNLLWIDMMREEANQLYVCVPNYWVPSTATFSTMLALLLLKKKEKEKNVADSVSWEKEELLFSRTLQY